MPLPHIDDAVALEPYGAVYIEAPKAACSSIKIALARLLGVDLTSVAGNPHEAVFPVPPPPVAGSRGEKGEWKPAFTRGAEAAAVQRQVGAAWLLSLHDQVW